MRCFVRVLDMFVCLKFFILRDCRIHMARSNITRVFPQLRGIQEVFQRVAYMLIDLHVAFTTESCQPLQWNDFFNENDSYQSLKSPYYLKRLLFSLLGRFNAGATGTHSTQISQKTTKIKGISH